MRRLAFLFALLLIATIGVSAARAAVGPLSLMSGPTPFSPGCEGTPQGGTNYPNAEVEPWVDANPLNPRNLIAVWQQDRWSTGGAHGLLTGVSENGGQTWTRPTPPTFSRCAGGTAANGGDYARASDPWVSFAPNGDAYQISLSVEDAAVGPSAVLVSKSEDNGHTWGPVTTLIRDTSPQFFNDKESITADPTDSRYAYAVWDRLDQVPGVPGAPSFGPTWFSRTTDGGQTWEPARPIFDPGPNNQTIGNQIVVLPNGDLINEFDLIADGLPHVAIIRSTDNGQTWSQPVVVDLMLGTVLFGNGVVDPSDGAPVRTGDILPDIAADPRPGTNNLYVVWQDARFTQLVRDQIVMSSSTDGGLTWTDPKRVSENKAVQAFTGSVHVRRNGHVGVNYYDFTADDPTGGTLDTDYWATASRNGGTTFSLRERITPNSFDMRTAPVARGFFVGDYEGLTSAKGAFHPVFVQANNGNLANRTDVFSTTWQPTFGVSTFRPEVLTPSAERKAQSAAPKSAFDGALRRN
jgi:hypothetical protein